MAGYKVYYGLQSQQYSWSVNAGPHTEAVVSELQEERPYFFAVTAYDANGRESGFSNEVVHILRATAAGSMSNHRSAEPPGGRFLAESIVVLPDYASSFVFTQRNRVLVTQKGGFGGSQSASVWVVTDGRLENSPLITFRDVETRGEMGLLGLAIDPDYGANRFVYVLYTHEPSKTNRLARVRDDVAQGRVEVEQLAAIPVDSCGENQGGGLIFGQDGTLYVGVGDGGCDPCVGQEMNSLLGKILRFTRDGTIPNDNPHPGSPVFAVGFRNPLGLAVRPDGGDLFAIDGGRGAINEVNRVVSGQNYGSKGSQCWLNSEEARSPAAPPGTPSIGCCTRDVTLGGIAFYSGGRYPDRFEGSLFYGNSASGALRRMVVSEGGDDHIADEHVLSGFGIIKDLAVSPGGLLYVLTEREIYEVDFAPR